MSPFQIVGWSAVGVVLLGVVVVGFSRPSPRRTTMEWIAASALYVAIGSIFGSLVRRAWAEDSTLGLVAFGFLLAMFAGGFCVSVVQTIQSLRSPRKTITSATH